MPVPTAADRKIADKELELARLQTNAAYQELEANIEKNDLHMTLRSSSVISKAAVEEYHRFSEALDRSIQGLMKELNGKHDDNNR